MDQNQQNINQAPIAPITPPEHKKVGPIIATLVIILILVIAALVMFASRLNQTQDTTTDNTADTSSNTQVTTNDTSSTSASLETVKPITNTADDAQSLQTDLNNSTTGLDNQNF